jgi:hypothetical protein
VNKSPNRRESFHPVKYFCRHLLNPSSEKWFFPNLAENFFGKFVSLSLRLFLSKTLIFNFLEKFLFKKHFSGHPSASQETEIGPRFDRRPSRPRRIAQKSQP